MKNYIPRKDLLAGRIVLVTGAGAGIGRAAALGFAAHGASLILLGRTAVKLEAVYDAIEASGAPKPALIPLDLATAGPDACDQVARVIEQEFGRLDGLLHNAAELGTLTPFEHYNDATWDRVMQVNVRAAFLLTRACLPLLKKSADASVIFTSADVGRQGRAYWGAYGASCHAIEGMMEILADELAANTNVRVNSIDPGPVRTGMRARAYPGENPAHLPRPEDILAAYLYLMGPDSRGVTGQALAAQPR